MTKLKAHFDGKVLVPDEPVDLPTDCELEILVNVTENIEPSQKTLASLAKAFDRLEPNPDLPADGAAQHDHYLYGTPKRS